MSRAIVCLMVALWMGGAAAEVMPSTITRRANFGTEISCPHFRARLRSYLRGIGELPWRLDEKARRWELENYFKNRLAADPYDVAGQRVADVSWSLPKDSLSGAQVVGFYELTARDYDGAQMHFEVPGREVRQKSADIEIRSPVRMADVCINGYVDVQVLSECPVDKVNVVAPLECQKVRTIRLSLAGVEATLRGEKFSLDRSAGARSLPVDAKPPCGTEDTNAANLLEALREVRSLHNCEINVVKRVRKDAVEYSIYARDLYACKSSAWACLESELSVAVPAICIGAGVSPSVRFTSGVTHSRGNFSAVFSAQLNRMGQLMSLSLSHLDRSSGRIDDYVICRPEIYGGNHVAR